MYTLIGLIRFLVFAAVTIAVLAAVASWLVRTKQVNPLTPLGRSLRQLSDLLLKPTEERLVRAGHNPVNAGWWLVVVVAVVGLASLALLGWLAARIVETSEAMRVGGGRGLLWLVLDWGVSLLTIAIIVRVIGTWFGFEFRPWMRPVVKVTDPILKPIARLVNPIGGLDFSPLIAIVALWILKQLLLGVIW
jgi:YggT family protein